MIKIYLLILFIISLINGCTSVDYSRQGTASSQTATPSQITIPIDEPIVTNNDLHQPRVITTAALDRNLPVKQKKNTPPASRQAVLDLLAQSKLAMEQYHYDEAEGLLKRALRIEPGNAWLWHNMAVLNFYQQDFQQAIQQALKSNNLGENSPQLRTSNSKVIKQSYIELGEPQKAKQY